jgi:hypothetical protein
MSSSCRKLYVALGAGALLGLGHGSHADNWELLPRLEGGGTFNNNYRLADTSAGKLQVYGPYIDAQVTAQMISQVSKLEIVPRIHWTNFPTDHADQSTDGYLDIDGEHKTQRSDFTGVAQYSNQTVIYSELLPATFPGVALGQVVPGQSGVVSVRNREQQERAVPNFTYDVTQRAHLNLQGEYDHASFNHSAIQQVGYDNYTGGAGLGYDISPRSVFTVSGVGSRFIPQSGGHDTSTYGAQLQWDLRQSQITHFYARLGVERSEADVTTTGTTTGTTIPPVRVTASGPGTPATGSTVGTTGVTGGVGVDLRYQITEVTLDALRALAPSDAGAEVVTNEVRFRVLHAFQPRFSGFLGVRGVELRGTSSRAPLTIEGEDYVAAEGGLDYQITQSYRIEATYDFTWQRFQGQPTASSNEVAVAFIYQPLSRYEPLPELTGIPQER